MRVKTCLLTSNKHVCKKKFLKTLKFRLKKMVSNVGYRILAQFDWCLNGPQKAKFQLGQTHGFLQFNSYPKNALYVTHFFFCLVFIPRLFFDEKT